MPIRVINPTKKMIVFKNPDDGQDYHIPPTLNGKGVLVPLSDFKKLPAPLRAASTKGAK